MFSYKNIFSILLLITAPLYLGTIPLFAQNQTTLTIQEGRVLINGKQLDEDQIPRSLDLEDLYVSLSFPSSVTPTFELNGRFYTIDDGELNELRRRNYNDEETTVVFRNKQESDEVTPSSASDVDRMPYESRSGRQSLAYASPQASAAVTTQYSAMMQQYISDVSKRDEALYKQLITELELERETKEIAYQARTLPEGPDRDEMTEHLRTLLGQIFDLKQENRQREIQQLEEQLIILKKRLAEREAMKDRIIDHRIGQLIESPY